MNKKEEILATITDLVSCLLYYDRREDEDLSVEDMETCVSDGTITIDEMVDHFRKELELAYVDD